MKIAVVVFLFGGASGGIKAANSIAAQLSKIGHDVCILTCEDVKQTFFEMDPNVRLMTIGKLSENKSNFGLEAREYEFLVHEARFEALRKKHRFFEDLLYRDLTLLQPDCVISVLFQTHFFAIPAAVRAGIPVIASEHNSPKSYQELWWMTQDELNYLYYLLGFTDKIHILSSLFAEGYPSFLKHKMVVIGNIVDNVGCVDQMDLSSRNNCIIAVGELSKWKNYEVLIDAFSIVANQFPDWVLKIYGEGPEKDKLLKKIKSRP